MHARHDGVQVWVDGLDPFDRRVDEFERRHLPESDELRLANQVQRRELFVTAHPCASMTESSPTRQLYWPTHDRNSRVHQSPQRHRCGARADRSGPACGGWARPVDVLVDKLEMCHRFDFADRLAVCIPTLPPAELLLSKLQVVKINRKDILDALALLSEVPLARDDQAGAAISLSRITSLTS